MQADDDIISFCYGKQNAMDNTHFIQPADLKTNFAVNTFLLRNTNVSYCSVCIFFESTFYATANGIFFLFLKNCSLDRNFPLLKHSRAL